MDVLDQMSRLTGQVDDGVRGDRRLAFGRLHHGDLLATAAAKVAPEDVQRQEGQVRHHGGRNPDPTGAPHRCHPSGTPPVGHHALALDLLYDYFYSHPLTQGAMCICILYFPST